MGTLLSRAAGKAMAWEIALAGSNFATARLQLRCGSGLDCSAEPVRLASQRP